MRTMALAAFAASALCAANCHALNYADFEALPELGRDLNSRLDGKVTITKYHNNLVTNGVHRNWIEFHCGEVDGVLPDVTNITVMGCETVQAVFHGTEDEWSGMKGRYRERYLKIRMVSPWQPQKADILKLREVVVDRVCLWCEELPPHRHAVFSATFDTKQTLEDHFGFNFGFHFYVDARYLIDDE